MTRMAIPSGDRMLVGDLVEPDEASSGPSSGLLFVHGYASDRQGYLRRAQTVCRRLGLTCLAFDLSGHGESPGSLNQLGRDDHLRDALAAYDVLAGVDGIDPTRIGVCAASYGGYLSSLLVAERRVCRLLLRAPALYVDAGVPAAPGLDETSDTNTALHNLASFRAPALILESGQDEVIPRHWIDAYVAAAADGTHHVIEGATHSLLQESWEKRFLDEILMWFSDLDRR